MIHFSTSDVSLPCSSVSLRGASVRDLNSDEDSDNEGLFSLMLMIVIYLFALAVLGNVCMWSMFGG
jgi:hypothetical protein